MQIAFLNQSNYRMSKLKNLSLEPIFDDKGVRHVKSTQTLLNTKTTYTPNSINNVSRDTEKFLAQLIFQNCKNSNSKLDQSISYCQGW